MALIKKSWIKFIKLILVSKPLQAFCLFNYLIIIPIILLKMQKQDKQYRLSQNIEYFFKKDLFERPFFSSNNQLDNSNLITDEEYTQYVIDYINEFIYLKESFNGIDFIGLDYVRVVASFFEICELPNFSVCSNLSTRNCFNEVYLNYMSQSSSCQSSRRRLEFHDNLKQRDYKIDLNDNELNDEVFDIKNNDNNSFYSNKRHTQTSYSPISYTSKIKESILSVNFKFLNIKVKGMYADYDLINPSSLNIITDISQSSSSSIVSLFQSYKKTNRLKSFFIVSNFYSINSNTHFTLKLGYEYFYSISKPVPIFDFFIFNTNFTQDILLYLSFICLILFSSIYLLMMFYEINMLPRFNIHVFVIIGELFAFGLIGVMALLFYSLPTRSIKEEVESSDGFINYLHLESMLIVMKILLSLNLFAYPFKIFSFLSFFEYFSVIKNYANVIFRLSPSLFLGTFIIGLYWISFSVILHILYGNQIIEMSNILYSIVYLLSGLFNTFTHKTSSKYLDTGTSLSHNDYFSIFNLVFIIMFILLLAVVIATVVFNFKKAFLLEFDIEDPVLEQLKKIKNQIDSLNESEAKDIQEEQCIKKHQVLWLNLTNSFKTYHYYHNNTKELVFMYFVNAQQIIAFMKYLFAIKPNMLYKKLEMKFTIVVQVDVSMKQIVEKSLTDIEMLVNWLNYIRSKIKLVFLSKEPLNKKTVYCLGMSYEHIKIINDENIGNDNNTSSKPFDVNESNITVREFDDLIKSIIDIEKEREGS